MDRFLATQSIQIGSLKVDDVILTYPKGDEPTLFQVSHVHPAPRSTKGSFIDVHRAP